MKRRKTVVIPMVRKKQHHGRNPFVTQLEATQFALERAVKRISALEKQCDGLAKLDKQKDIRINQLGLEMKRLREVVERRESE
jgi:hypothetical protein